MEKLTTLNLSPDRVLIQLIVPGLIASYPFIILFFDHIPNAADFFLQDGRGLLIAFITLIALVVGIILENFGSHIEVYYYDKRQKKLHGDSYMDIWKKYLKISYSHEPIGQRYIRNILFRMKFELSMGVALSFMSAGLLIYNLNNQIFENQCLNLFLVYILPIGIAVYLIFFEGWSSSKILESTRRSLVESYYKP